MNHSLAVGIKTRFMVVGLVGFGLTIAPPPTTATEVYKVELREASETPSKLSGERFKKVRGQSEWAVLTLNEPNVVQLKQMKRLANSYGISKWFENSVTQIFACPIVSGDCSTVIGNRFEIPKNKTVKDFRFEFQFIEENMEQVRSVQVPSDRLAEKPVIPSRSRGNR